MTAAAADLGTVCSVRAEAYTVPTDAPESDGTLAWDSTTVLVAHVEGGGAQSLGYSYTDASAAALVNGVLADVAVGRPIADVGGSWAVMVDQLRNLGRPGLGSAALSALDVALWDLKARALNVPVAALTPSYRSRVPVYGSGGFTSYTGARLQEQLGGWVAAGMSSLKMKVGRNPAADLQRVTAAREAIGDAQLFVDANGAWTRKQALGFAFQLADLGVSWLEEPVSSDDLAGLRLIRDRGPAGMDVLRGSTATTRSPSAECSRRARSTACRPTSPAAAASPASCASLHSATPTAWICQPTPLRR
jgi:L-alanine-DL-glutamate epimerase-like enolase superfamily enzyme